MATKKTALELEYGKLKVRIVLLKCIIGTFLITALVLHCVFLGLETISKAMMAVMIIALLCHIFLAWGVLNCRCADNRNVCILMICAGSLKVDIMARIALWHPSALFIAGFVLDIFLVICTYYLCYLLTRRCSTLNAIVQEEMKMVTSSQRVVINPRVLKGLPSSDS